MLSRHFPLTLGLLPKALYFLHDLLKQNSREGKLLLYKQRGLQVRSTEVGSQGPKKIGIIQTDSLIHKTESVPVRATEIWSSAT